MIIEVSEKKKRERKRNPVGFCCDAFKNSTAVASWDDGTTFTPQIT
jgi:hypothetical protein